MFLEKIIKSLRYSPLNLFLLGTFFFPAIALKPKLSNPREAEPEPKEEEFEDEGATARPKEEEDEEEDDVLSCVNGGDAGGSRVLELEAENMK